jgi:hypothetical protein
MANPKASTSTECRSAEVTAFGDFINKAYG